VISKHQISFTRQKFIFDVGGKVAGESGLKPLNADEKIKD
jgi:hypothetical protein